MLRDPVTQSDQTNAAAPAPASDAHPHSVQVLVAEPGPAGPSAETGQLAAALRAAGLEVPWPGPFADIAAVASAAVRVGAQAVLLCNRSGLLTSLFLHLQQELDERGHPLPLVLCGVDQEAERRRLVARGARAAFPSVTDARQLAQALRAAAARPRATAELLPTRLDHTAVCVRDLDAAIALFSQLLGQPLAAREVVESQKVSAAFFDLPNGASIELISPEASLGGNAGLERFLEKRGEGLHHLALRVRGLDALLARLEKSGVPLIDRVGRAGARGHRVAFLHPKALAGTLLELVEVER